MSGLYPYGYYIAVKLCVQDVDLNLEPGMPADVIFEAGSGTIYNEGVINQRSFISAGTVIGSHTGPGTVALFFVGDKRKD